MKKNKNYTVYLLAGISAILTIPIGAIIFSKVQADIVAKTAMIMVTFIILFVAILLLYKNIFGVSVREIAQEEKVTEIDRLIYTLSECRKRHTNTQVRKCIDIVNDQMHRFQRRKAVLLQVTGTEAGGNDSGAIGDLVQSVEDVLVNSIQRLINRVEIFDDQGSPEIIRQNIGYLEELLFKNNEILTDFEKLITEASQMGETQDDMDISKLRDVINAMQSLRTDRDDEIDELAKKYK